MFGELPHDIEAQVKSTALNKSVLGSVINALTESLNGTRGRPVISTEHEDAAKVVLVAGQIGGARFKVTIDRVK